MPQALARACTSFGCGNTLPCPVHSQQKQPQRESAHQRGYTRTWRTASRLFLKRYPLCGMRPGKVPPVMSRCYNEGKVTPATLVDHQVPHRGDRQRFWDRSNWAAMCETCHNRKTQAGM